MEIVGPYKDVIYNNSAESLQLFISNENIIVVYEGDTFFKISYADLSHARKTCTHSLLKYPIMQVKNGSAFVGPKGMTLNVKFYLSGTKKTNFLCLIF